MVPLSWPLQAPSPQDMRWLRVEVVTSALGKSGVRIGFLDEGPGIADVDLALTDGWSSGVGLGLGLSGARRLVDEFELTSKPGTGTSVVVVKWSR